MRYRAINKIDILQHAGNNHWRTTRPSLALLLGSLGISLLVHLMVGFSEELMARGYWMQNLAEKLGLPWAAVLSAALFSLLHAGNPGYSWMAFLGLFAGGFDVAYGYARTRSVWLPIGLHMGWNFFGGGAV